MREGFFRPAPSPDLSKDRSCPERDEHRLSIGSSDHLHLPSFYDVHLPAHFILRGKGGHKHLENLAGARCVGLQAKCTFLQT